MRCPSSELSPNLQRLTPSSTLNRSTPGGSTKLFGNFIELLDDVTPGMWAELLNDRSFEGVVPAANWCYYDGSLNICNRQWDTNATWTLDSGNPFNGARSARLNAGPQAARLTQSGLGVKKGMTYAFCGYLRAEGGVKAAVRLKFLLPTGEWMTLASAELPAPSEQWKKYSVRMVSAGRTGQAVFELSAEGQGSLWADKLSLMPEDNLQGWRRDVVRAIQGPPGYHPLGRLNGGPGPLQVEKRRRQPQPAHALAQRELGQARSQ